MSGQYRENWKRLANKLPQTNTSKDDPDVVRFQDLGTLTANASGIGGFPINGTPASGDLIIFDGTSWVYSSGSLTGGQTIDGFPIVGTPASGDMLAFNGTAWVYVASGVLGGGGGGAPTGPAGGDLTSNYPNPQVSGIRGVEVSPTTPVLDQVMRYDGTRWVPDYSPGLGGFVTVGGSPTSEVPNPSYSNMAAAIAAKHRNMVVVSDITDTALNSFPSGGIVHLQNTVWTTPLVAGNFTSDLAIYGPGTITDQNPGTSIVVIQTSGPVAGAIPGKGVLTLESLNINGKIQPGSLGRIVIRDCVVDGSLTLNGEIDANGLRIWKRAGGGSIAGQTLEVLNSGNVNITNLTYEGGAFTDSGNIMNLSKITSPTLYDSKVNIDGVSFWDVPPVETVILATTHFFRLNNLHRNYGRIKIDTQSSTPCKQGAILENCIGEFSNFVGNGNGGGSRPICNWRFSNCIGSGFASFLTNSTNSSGNMYDNCKIGNPTAVTSAETAIAGGQEHTYNNVTFYQDLTIRGRRHIFTGCRFWGNVTLDASTSGCLVVGCRIEGTITDNGVDNIT